MGNLASKQPILIQSKLYGLDHLRALAIAFVFLYHYRISIFGHPQWIYDYVKFGWTGVDLFFVLSGFLISSQLFAQIKQGHTISYKEFFLKRFFRILPAFWIVVAIYFCLPAFHEREALSPLWKFVTFTQNLGLNIQDSGTFSHAWSLCVEEHFYLLLPLSLALLLSANFFNKAHWLLLALFLLGFFIRSYSWNHFYLPEMGAENSWMYWYKYIYYPTWNRLDGLLMGVAIAALYQFLPSAFNRVSKFGNLLLLISLVLLTTAYFVCYHEQSYCASVFGFPLVSLGYGFMVVGAISPTSLLYKWKSKPTTFIAMLSYSIYLTHKGIIHVTQEILSNVGLDKNSNLMLFICIACCLAAALLLNLVIEKPFMKLRMKVIKTD